MLPTLVWNVFSFLSFSFPFLSFPFLSCPVLSFPFLSFSVSFSFSCWPVLSKSRRPLEPPATPLFPFLSQPPYQPQAGLIGIPLSCLCENLVETTGNALLHIVEGDMRVDILRDEILVADPPKMQREPPPLVVAVRVANDTDL